MATITHTIADNKLDAFKTGFLRRCPVPKDAHGNPEYSDNAWIKEWGRRQYMSKYLDGAKEAALEAASFEMDIIT